MSATESPSIVAVRVAGPADADAIGALLHDFNREFGEPTPGPEWLAARVRALLAEGEIVVLVAGDGQDGLAVLRFSPAIWADALECYVAELYVRPERRRAGLGRALMEAAMQVARGRGADMIHLGTGESDTAARALYESLGFSNREGGPEGPLAFWYVRAL
jgi:ribosomal protein S18 acetylase RimI-like enzyme